jgi:hypothetical protein
MTTVLIAAMATACILTAVEGLLISLGKWRGLLGLVASLGFCLTLDTKLSYLPVYGLAATFGGLVMSILVEQLSSPATTKLPKPIPPR